MNGPRQAISKLTAESEGLAVAIRDVAVRLQGLFAGLVLVALLGRPGLLAAVLRDPSLAPHIRLAAPIVLFMAIFSVYVASLNGLHAFGRQATAMVVLTVGRLLFALLGAWLWGIPGARQAWSWAPGGHGRRRPASAPRVAGSATFPPDASSLSPCLSSSSPPARPS